MLSLPRGASHKHKKAVYRILRAKKWLCHERRRTPRPRVHGRVFLAGSSNERWAIDVTHIDCGSDGWGHLAAVTLCHDREIGGYEFSLRGRAKEAEGASEGACPSRFGTLRPQGRVPVVRSDNGLIFQSRRFRPALRDYRLSQEFSTSYTPEQNGIIERFFRSIREECAWQHNFGSLAEAQQAVNRWIEH